ncbi:gliding motility-associated ABC transporter ATP-binding subunit GldA [Bacteroidota bacterium]
MPVEVIHLTKEFGTQKAVNDITFTAEDGQILGFLGPNGAGKSTTMKIATTFLPPTSGTIQVAGYDVIKDPIEVKKLVGYLPEHNPMYQDMYVHEYLGFIASLHKLKGSESKKRVAEMIHLTGLAQEQNKKIEALSKGYRQRVGLAQTLIHDPKVLILDEPTTGLDPNQIIEIRKLIRDLSKNKTVILSTHIMQEVQALCDQVVIIDQGRIVADDSVENLKNVKSDHVVVNLEFSSPVEIDNIQNIEGVIGVEVSEENNYRIFADKSIDIRSRLFQLASEKGWPLVGLTLVEDSMEQVFRELTRKEENQ